MITNDAASFNKNIDAYINARPGYPNKIYEIIDNNTEINSNSRILEIGCGNGIATEEIINKWNPFIIGIEPGKDLFQILVNRFHSENKVSILNTTYEEYENRDPFDAIISATAFHWINKDCKYEKTHQLLKSSGNLILYWNNFGIKEKEIETILDDLYVENGFEKKQKSTIALQDDKINERHLEIEAGGYFSVFKHEIVENIITYSSDRYIELLKTFPDHSTQKNKRINILFKQIKNALKNYNNQIDLRIRINLEIARKT